MIEYSPFWETLSNSGETTYTLINKHHISSAILDKLRKNKPMNTTTLNDLCRILHCGLDEIARYIPSEEKVLKIQSFSCYISLIYNKINYFTTSIFSFPPI